MFWHPGHMFDIPVLELLKGNQIISMPPLSHYFFYFHLPFEYCTASVVEFFPLCIHRRIFLFKIIYFPKSFYFRNNKVYIIDFYSTFLGKQSKAHPFFFRKWLLDPTSFSCVKQGEIKGTFSLTKKLWWGWWDLWKQKPYNGNSLKKSIRQDWAQKLIGTLRNSQMRIAFWRLWQPFWQLNHLTGGMVM